MPKRIEIGPCRVIGCGKPIKTMGMCKNHYQMNRLHGRTEKVRKGDMKTHPLYRIWWERKSRGGLCPEWNDFYTFIRDVGDRPADTYTLARIRHHEDYGPANFRWVELLRREPGETQKEFWARKWQARKKRNPTFERRRHLVRKFGITTEQYEQMLKEQKGVCAICRRPETRSDSATGKKNSLAVDHNHENGGIRDLLCWRCNATLGQMEESVQLMEAMIAYVKRWAILDAAESPRPHRLMPNVHEIIINTEWGPMNVADAARMAGLSASTVRARIRYEWPEDKLLQPLRLTPSKRRKLDAADD